MVAAHVFVAVVILALSATAAVAQVCSKYTNCPQNCPDGSFNEDAIAPLSLELGPEFTAFHANMRTAESIMSQFPGVASEDTVPWLHTTFEYFCCLNVSQYNVVAEVLGAIEWTPLNVSFSQVVCNSDAYPDPGNHNSFILLLDPASQALVGAFVDEAERRIEAAGVPIHVPRSSQEPFHVTLGVVNSSYPIASVLAQINAAVETWAPTPLPIAAYFMTLPPRIFRAAAPRP